MQPRRCPIKGTHHCKTFSMSVSESLCRCILAMCSSTRVLYKYHNLCRVPAMRSRRTSNDEKASIASARVTRRSSTCIMRCREVEAATSRPSINGCMERNAISAWRTSVCAWAIASGGFPVDDMASKIVASFPAAARRPKMAVVIVSGSIAWGGPGGGQG
jgi:hypothetical protein